MMLYETFQISQPAVKCCFLILSAFLIEFERRHVKQVPSCRVPPRHRNRRARGGQMRWNVRGLRSTAETAPAWQVKWRIAEMEVESAFGIFAGL